MEDDDMVKDEAVDENEKNDKKQSTSMPLWKKILLGIALFLGILGAAMYAVNMTYAPSTPAGEMSAQGVGQKQLAQVGEQTITDMITTADWSALLMKLGFSFLIGFAVAYALSSILKMTLLVVGVAALLLLGLQYGGLIDVNWTNFESYYDVFITWLQPHIGGFKDFITSNLPSSTSAAAGLAIGFRRF